MTGEVYSADPVPPPDQACETANRFETNETRRTGTSIEKELPKWNVTEKSIAKVEAHVVMLTPARNSALLTGS